MNPNHPSTDRNDGDERNKRLRGHTKQKPGTGDDQRGDDEREAAAVKSEQDKRQMT